MVTEGISDMTESKYSCVLALKFSSEVGHLSCNLLPPYSLSSFLALTLSYM